MKRFVILGCAVIVVGLFVASGANRGSTQILAPTVTQRVYHYGAGPTIQTDIPCGSSTDALVVYVEIKLHAYGLNTRSLTDGVGLDGTLLWEQVTTIAIHPEFGTRQVARYYQRLTQPGLWTFKASVPDSEANRCTVAKF